MAIANIKWAGVAAGAGAALIGNALVPVLGGALKLVTKAFIKTSLLTYAGSKELVDRTTKTIEQIATEAREELKVGAKDKPAAKKTTTKPAAPKKRTIQEAT